MAVFFLIIIYLSFISLGLPDPLLGSAWPLMHRDLGVPLGSAGLISMVMTAGMIISGLASGIAVKRLGTGKIVFLSCFMTAASLLGFSFSHSFVWLLLLAFPLGLGAGSVDAGLNNYVAIHYKAHHMSWLHCCWGIGATVGPLIMSLYIGQGSSWRNGYLTVSIMQFILAAVLFFTLPLWKKIEQIRSESKGESEAASVDAVNEADYERENGKKPIRIKGVKLAMLSFLFYCGVEATMGLWGSSYLVSIKGLDAATAAQWVSAYYSGIMAGRFITGFITLKLNNRVIIRMGQFVCLAGALLLILPLPPVFSLAGFMLVGLGCAPIFPCMVHETPRRFGKLHSQTIVGFQMASAYAGGAFLPPLLGLVSTRLSIGIFPIFVVVFIITMLACSEKINMLMRKREILKGIKIPF